MSQITLIKGKKKAVLMQPARYSFIFLVSLLLILTGGCQGQAPPRIYANQIKVEYPDGMTVANGGVIEIVLVNKSNYCIQFPVSGSIPVFVYVENGSVQVQNDMAYAWSAIKMSPSITTSSRRKFQVAPYLDPHDDAFNLPLYSAYIPLDGFICDDATITVSIKVPFFIQYYTDY
jgi:hypothetical protein